jgi:C4-type Zn-finger protein
MERHEGRQIELMSVPCPLCGSDDCSILHTERTQYFGTPVALSVVRCRECGLDYTNPRIAEVNAVYEDGEPGQAEAIEAYNKRKRPVFENALRRIRRLLSAAGVHEA